MPEASFNLLQLCRRYLNSEPLVVGSADCNPGIGIDVDMPAQEVGADRVANAVAAHDRYKMPLMVVDFGTATNFDVVDQEGQLLRRHHRAGPNLSLQALEMAAAQLPHIAIGRPPARGRTQYIGAMQSGVFWGYVGLIEGLVRRIREERGEKMGIVATGGLAPLFAGATDTIDKVDPDLTLWGLRLIYRRNRNQ